MNHAICSQLVFGLLKTSFEISSLPKQTKLEQIMKQANWDQFDERSFEIGLTNKQTKHEHISEAW